MDCHNRPAHKFRSPQDAVDVLLDVGKIDSTLPYMKREVVRALVTPYADEETASLKIANHLIGFYKSEYPEVWTTRKSRFSVNEAVDMARMIYSRGFFPSMKVDWRTYPDNIGHLISPGCFRCHDGKHVNQRGDQISHECNVCHTFLNPVQRNGHNSFIQEGEFIHPLALEGPHAALRCDRCHTGGESPGATCAACHTEQAAFRTGTMPAFESFGIPAEPMADSVGCEDCHNLSAPTTVEAINTECLGCHEKDGGRFTNMLASWKAETDRLLDRAAATTDAAGLQVLDTLRQAGPLHNVEATRVITAALSGSAQSEATSGPDSVVPAPAGD